MSEESNLPLSSRPLSRRTVAKGLAWAVPMIAVVQAVPASSASPCLPVASPPQWTWERSVNTNNQQTTFEGDVFHMWIDSTSDVGTNTATVTATSPAITGLQPGCDYTLFVDIRTQGGFTGDTRPSGGCTTENTNVAVNAVDTAGTTTLHTFSTQSTGGGTVVPFPVPTGDFCPGNYGFGDWVTSSPLSAHANGTSFQLQLAFLMWGSGPNGGFGNNDDYQIRLRFEDCSCN